MFVGNTKMPDAMETIFEAALDLGKLGGVSFLCLFTKNIDEQSKNNENKTINLSILILIYGACGFFCRLRRLWEIQRTPETNIRKQCVCWYSF